MRESESVLEHANCWTCGYSLRGLTEHRCPECGREFDPDNKYSVDVGIRRERIERWLLAPPSSLLIYMYVLWALATLWSVSAPRGNGAAITMCTLCGIGVVVWWAAHLLTSQSLKIRYRISLMSSPAEFRRWAALPTIAATVGLLIVARVPLYARFLVSWPFLSRLAAMTAKDPASLPKRGMVGLYHADSIAPLAGGIRIEINSRSKWEDGWGFVWMPDGAAVPDSLEPHLRPFFGNWRVYFDYGGWF